MDTPVWFQEKLSQFHEIGQHIVDYSHAIGLLYYEDVTNPSRGSIEARSHTMGFLAGERHGLQTSEDTWSLIAALEKHPEWLSDTDIKVITYIKRYYAFEHVIPKDLFRQYMTTVHESEHVWRRAKKENNYQLMIPFYEKIVSFQKHFALILSSKNDPYDTLLDRYEHGFSQVDYDAIFAEVKTAILPLIKRIAAKNDSTVKISFPPVSSKKQQKLAYSLLNLLGLPSSICSVGETEHPFTIKICRDDLRVTTKYFELDPFSNFFTIMHEGGHALYEHWMDIHFGGSVLCEGASMGIHESQSRFFENYVGRNYFFLTSAIPLIEEAFEQSLCVSPKVLYRALNKSTPSLIRTEADELTYPIHVIIRYEIEKKLFDGSLNLCDADKYWDYLYDTYLGVHASKSSEGILQDSHWSGGSFAYFPSYLLGSAYAAQLLNSMKQEVDFERCLTNLNIAPIIEWLDKKVYVWGPTKNPREILKNATGQEFSVRHYIEYLTEKYKKLYELQGED